MKITWESASRAGEAVELTPEQTWCAWFAFALLPASFALAPGVSLSFSSEVKPDVV